MSQNNNIIKSQKNKHLTERQRYDIECLLKEGNNASYIAQRIEKSKRTVEREIKRGSVIQRDTNLLVKK